MTLHECSICLEEDEQTYQFCLENGHRFHKHCYYEWKNFGKGCPLCRSDVFAYNYTELLIKEITVYSSIFNIKIENLDDVETVLYEYIHTFDDLKELNVIFRIKKLALLYLITQFLELNIIKILEIIKNTYFKIDSLNSIVDKLQLLVQECSSKLKINEFVEYYAIMEFKIFRTKNSIKINGN